MYEKVILSECEMVTMRCVWNMGQNGRAVNVINMLAEDYGVVYKETTVYTFLKKLKEKGFLDTFRRGVTYYVPRVEESVYLKEMAKRLVNFWYNGNAADAAEAVLEGENLTRKEQKQVRDALKKTGES